MGLYLLALFIAVPLIEIGLFIEVGGWIGLWPTLLIVVVTAIAGTVLLRLQGILTLSRIRTEMDAGRLPTRELFDGACLLAAGMLLLTPGFFTDTVGFLLFVPAVRDALRRFFADRMTVAVHRTGEDDPEGPGTGPVDAGDRKGRTGSSGPVIDAEFEDIEDPPNRRDDS